jgi:hypothetical protein
MHEVYRLLFYVCLFALWSMVMKCLYHCIVVFRLMAREITLKGSDMIALRDALAVVDKIEVDKYMTAESRLAMTTELIKCASKVRVEMR